MTKLICSVCLSVALASPLLAASQLERDQLSLELASGALPIVDLGMPQADRSECYTWTLSTGILYSYDFVLSHECCNWEFNTCLSGEADTWIYGLTGPGGLSLSGQDDPGVCPMACSIFNPDVLSPAYGVNNNGGAVPNCLPAGVYTVYFRIWSAYDASCFGLTQTPFTICLNGCDGGGTVGADEQPAAFALAQNTPNPFNPATTIRFSLPETSAASLKVYDLSGREVASLLNGVTPRGEQSVTFDASQLASGVYVYTLSAEGRSLSQKMVLVK